MAGYECAAPSARDAVRLPSLVAAVATLVGLSLSLATPAVIAGTGSATAVVNATVGGLATGKPHLRFAITTQGSFPVTAVTVALPSGLAFSRKGADLDHGVRVGTGTPRTSVRRGHLTVTTHRASSNFVLTIAGSAMTESTSLENTVTKLVHFNQSHMSNQRALPLTFTLTLESGAHATLRLLDTIAFR
ncbi:MAG: hypothetical protein M3065_11980 [Actinomycetota bacterium]|nr:hypothetical protein [Actinomycetota bacterium]